MIANIDQPLQHTIKNTFILLQMNKNLKLDVWKKIIIITIQDKFLLTNFSLRINFHKELIIFTFFSVVLKSYVCRLCNCNGYHPNI